MTRLARMNGKVMRSNGRVTTCPCCGGGACVCDEDDTIELDSCCCLDPSDPAYCGDDGQRCQAPCIAGPCTCQEAGMGIDLPACCCLPLTHPLSCAGDFASCIAPCNTKNGCGGCDCCANNCGTDLGAYSGSMSATYKGYHDPGTCANKSDEVSVTVVCSGVRTTCNTRSGTCTFSGVWKEWSLAGTLKTHWETSYTASISACAADFITNGSWIVGPSPSGPRIIRVTDCNSFSQDVCRRYAGSSGTSNPCGLCVAVASCSNPPCGSSLRGGRGLGCAQSPAYEISASGLLTPIRAIEMSRMIDPSACPLCHRPGWDLVWRSEEALRGRHRPSAISHQIGREASMPKWKKGRAPMRRTPSPAAAAPSPSVGRGGRSAPAPVRSAPTPGEIAARAEQERRMQQQMNAASGHDPRRCGGCGN